MRKIFCISLLLCIIHPSSVLAVDASSGRLGILFKGNNAIGGGVLIKQMPLLVAGDAILRDSIEVAVSRIRSYYSRQGYLDIAVGHFLHGDSLTITIAEGPLYRIEEISFTGNRQLPTELLAKAVTSKRGRGLDLAALGEDDFNLMLLYADFGYVYAEVEHEVSYSKGHRALLTFNVREGGQVAVGRVNVSGNSSTKTAVIMREMVLKEGQPFSRSMLLRSQRRLMDLDLFKNVTVTPGSIDNDSGLINIEVGVEEKPPRALSAGVGYGSGDAFRVTATWGHCNLSGLGRRLEFSLLNSFQLWNGLRLVRGRSQVSYREPWFWNTRTPLGISMYYDDFRPPYTDYRLQTVGIDLEISRQTGRYSNIGWRWKQEWLKLSPDWRDQGEAAETLSYRGRRSVMIFTDYQRFDDPVNPRRGLALDGELQYTGGFMGGAETFQRFMGECKFHSSIISLPFGVSGRIKLGIIGDWNLDFNAPLYEKFFLGGPFTVRGYSNGQFGDTDQSGNNIGGDKMGLLNAEFKIFLPKHWVGALFTDAALLENCTLSQLALKEWKSSPGLGLRYIYPFGTGRLDFAFPVSLWREIKYWKVVIAWGEAF
jgi:outer membrane protein insertion porin family